MNIPILYNIFNRIDVVKQSFASIKAQKPTLLFISADGPRHNVIDDSSKCQNVRSYVMEQIDWDCKVVTNFRENNLGCGIGMANAISWFFSHVEEGIIIEDDCVVSPDFFVFMEQMLEYYRYDNRVMHISGNCFGAHFAPKYQESYYFSTYPLSWGWATWKRAWKYYDFNLENLDLFIKKKEIENVFPFQKKIQKRWIDIFSKTKAGNINFIAWDFQWVFTLFQQHGLAVSPYYNLVTNIGDIGSHDTTKHNHIACEKLPGLRHPLFMVPNRKVDYDLYLSIYKDKNIIQKIKSKINCFFITNQRHYCRQKA